MMSAELQLSLCFDSERQRPRPRKPAAAAQRGPRQPGDPYHPFDAELAHRILLEQLHKAGGGWVRSMVLNRATGMHPSDVRRVKEDLERAGLIECTDAMDIIHPKFGLMGRTRGYRIAQAIRQQQTNPPDSTAAA